MPLDFAGAQVALGPLGVLFMGTSMQMTPIMARRARGPGRHLRTIAWKVSVTLGSVAAIWGLVLMLVPRQVGEAMLGSSWTATRSLLPIWVAFYVLSGLVAGPTIGLRGLGAARASLRLRAVVAPIGLTLGLLGAIADGPKGASVGLLIGNLIALPFWWRGFFSEASSNDVELSIV